MDVNTIHPNATYWINSANDALIRLGDVVGDTEARRMTENIEGTWREIYNAILVLAELAEKQTAIGHATNPPYITAELKPLDAVTDAFEAFGDADLGTRFVISGGEVMEL